MPSRSSGLHQLPPPGLPGPTPPFVGDYEIFWSVYVRCGARLKLRERHLPALDAIICAPHGPRDWFFSMYEWQTTEAASGPVVSYGFGRDAAGLRRHGKRLTVRVHQRDFTELKNGIHSSFDGRC